MPSNTGFLLVEWKGKSHLMEDEWMNCVDEGGISRLCEWTDNILIHLLSVYNGAHQNEPGFFSL